MLGLPASNTMERFVINSCVVVIVFTRVYGHHMLEKRSEFVFPILDTHFTTLALSSTEYFVYWPLSDPRFSSLSRF